jgi:hypothetical protein
MPLLAHIGSTILALPGLGNCERFGALGGQVLGHKGEACLALVLNLHPFGHTTVSDGEGLLREAGGAGAGARGEGLLTPRSVNALTTLG